MPNDVITLVPNVGSSLALTGSSYSLGMEVDWGEHVIDPQLASGSDVVGGVPGVRRREPTEASIPVRVHATDADDYVAAAEALASAATRLARYGGTVTHQIDFGGGDESVEVASTVYACNLDPEAGWMEAHRKDAVVTLNITRDPSWVETDPETLATQTSQSGGVITTAFAARGNLPGPAVFEMENPISTARRYWEVGGAVTQYQAADSYHYTGGQFTAGAASLGSDADSIDTSSGTLALATVLPTPQEMGRLTDLTHVGVYNVKVRVKGSDEDCKHFVRVFFRQSGGGPWREIGTAVVPDSINEAGTLDYFMVEVGVLRNYLASTALGVDTIDIRIDGYSDSSESGPSLSLDSLFLIPAELHVVARGIRVAQPPLENDIYDDWADVAEDVGVSSTAAIAPVATWGLQGDTDSPFTARGGGGIRREGAADSGSAITGGQYLVLGAAGVDVQTNVTAWLHDAVIKHKGSAGTQTILGLIVHFALNAGAPNGLMLCARAKRRTDGQYKVLLSLYKLTGSGPTVSKIKDFDQVDGRNLTINWLKLTLDTSGNWEAGANWQGRDVVGFQRSGTDTAFTSSPLNSGRVAVYSKIESSNNAYAFTEVSSISGSGEVVTAVESDVIRGSGTGRIVHYGAGAYSDDDAGGDEVQVPSVVGSRLYLPPGSGELVSVIRRGDSAVEPDTGHGDNNDLTLTHYPAWATLSDVLA